MPDWTDPSANPDGSDSPYPRHAENASANDEPPLEHRRAGHKANRYPWLALFTILGIVVLVVLALYFFVQPSGMNLTK